MARHAAKRKSAPRGEPARRKPSAADTQAVLLESGYKCGNPTCRAVLALQLHHIEWVKDGGGTTPDNLLPLCGYCHDLHTRGTIPASAIRVWKGILVSLTSGSAGCADMLLHLARLQGHRHSQYFAYSAGDLLVLAPLLNARLIDADFRGGSSGGITGPTAFFKIRLTPRGEALVAAWSAGSEDALATALKMPAA
jgi:hypothetical protein